MKKKIIVTNNNNAKKELIDFNNKHFNLVEAAEFNTLVEIASRIKKEKGKLVLDFTGINRVCNSLINPSI